VIQSRASVIRSDQKRIIFNDLQGPPTKLIHQSTVERRRRARDLIVPIVITATIEGLPESRMVCIAK
jgi:hypothetical protein